MFYSDQKRAEKARLEQICESSRMAATLHAKINRKKLDKLEISQICEEILNPPVPRDLNVSGILMGQEFGLSWLGGGVAIVGEREVKHLLGKFWDSNHVLDPTLLTQGRTHPSVLVKCGLSWLGGVYDRKAKHLFDDRDDVTSLLAEKADFGNFEQTPEKKWQHTEKNKACSGEGDTHSSSTNGYVVDSKGRLVDEAGFTLIGARSRVKPEMKPSGVEERVDIFLDMETMKFTSPGMAFFLRDQMSMMIDSMSDKKVKYKLGNINSFVTYDEDNDISKAVHSISAFIKKYRTRNLVCWPCKKDGRNHRVGKKTPLIDHDMTIRITRHAMKGTKAVVIISNDPFLYYTFANRLMHQFQGRGFQVIVPATSVTHMIPVAMYRKKEARDVRPRNGRRGARNAQRAHGFANQMDNQSHS